MVPSEWSTGEGQRLGLITKVGVPAIRRIITEMVWRMILFQPEYKAVQKWREVLEGSNRGLKKKAVVALRRQLMVDILRLQTPRITAPEPWLLMIEGLSILELTRKPHCLKRNSPSNRLKTFNF